MRSTVRLSLGMSLLALLSLSGISGQGQSGSKEQREAKEWELTFELLSQPIKSDKPRTGYVPDAKTAISIGEAIARVVYGEAIVIKEQPFRARLKDGVWTVMGTVNPPGALGGVAIIQIRKSNGEIVLATRTY